LNLTDTDFNPWVGVEGYQFAKPTIVDTCVVEWFKPQAAEIQTCQAGWERLTNLSWFESDRHGFQSVGGVWEATNLQNQPSSTLVHLGIL